MTTDVFIADCVQYESVLSRPWPCDKAGTYAINNH